MEHVDELIRKQSLASLASSIRKLERALVSVQQKDSSTTVIAKRLKALQMGLAALKSVWDNQVFAYTPKETDEAKTVLASLFPSLQAMASKFKPGSSQATLLIRRVRSLELALAALGEM
ncbi:hypothetical protein [Sphaerochaeta globosa]|uniref:Uncharacterized protein n=1 Tax=Sphaerochaeta globosa (strain ATCC BAA-1886 / DSM 22777 / Buddy) TaxID=158189 RepID=F0RUL8_SPHGB|nr:hypothetical protein [Sphaerochaeta globosa]ADY12380.1 hypothetical protein SpiBuddy_0547 [Sphaerochaeta globosa str. Buddy]